MAGRRTKKLTEKQVVDAAARRHKVPPWLLWGIYGAESTYGTNGSNYFGLIEPEYRMVNGNTRRPQNTANLAESADIAAELLWSLKQEHGSWAAAVDQYAPYSISHPRELSRGGRSTGRQLVSVDPNLISPQQQKELEKEGFSKKEIEEAGEAPIEKAGKPFAEAEKAIKAPFEIAEDIGTFLATLSKFIFTAEGWIQIGEVSGGIILIGWGLHHLIQASTGVNPTHTVTKTVAKATEAAALIPK